MHLYFVRLDIECFKAYREPASLNFAKMGKGVWFVSGKNEVSPRLGSNGAAKSTIFDAILWCLYGRTVKGHRTPDVVNWATGETPDVSLMIATGDNDSELDTHTIRRTGKANGLTLDGKTVTQERIDRLIGMPYGAALHSLILGQGKPLFFDLTPTGKMDVLSEGLYLERWDGYITAAKKRADNLDAEWRNKDSDLRALSKLLDEVAKERDDLEVKSKDWRKERNEAEAKREAEIKQLEEWLEQSRKRLGDADLAYERWETELRASQRVLDETKVKARPVIADRAAATAKFDACSEAERAALRARDKLVDADKCPHCGSKLDKRSIGKHRDELDRAVNEAGDALHDARQAMYSAIDADEAFASAEKAIGQDIKHFREKSNEAIDERTRAQNRCNELKAQLDALLDRQDESQAEANPYAELLSVVKQRWKQAVRDERRMADDLAALNTRHKQARYWVEGFKLLRLQLIDDTLAEMEAITQTMLAAEGLDDWKVEYAIEKENKSGTTKPGITVNIYQPEYDRPINWDLFSGGEGQRLRLLGALALSQTLLSGAGIVTDFLVLDEPTRHLSPEGVLDTVDLLCDMGRDRQIFYIDHQAVQTNRFQGTVRVRRDRDGATFTIV